MKKFTAHLSFVAEYKLIKILEYIEMEFGKNSRDKFLNKFSENIDKIESNPFSSPETEFDGIYKNVVSKQTSFYYRIKGFEIEVVTVSDNRHHPAKILKELKNWP